MKSLPQNGEVIITLKDGIVTNWKEISQGKNLDTEWSSLFECSVCHWSCWDTLCGDTSTYNYCPNCGAKIINNIKEQIEK